MTEAGTDAVVERAAQAVGSVIYGSDTDPFEQPERWEHLEKVAAAAIQSLSTKSEELAACLVDDPNWIAAGIPDEAIEAGIAAWQAAETDMENYRSGITPDWDEGMIVAAIFKAVARTALASHRGKQP